MHSGINTVITDIERPNGMVGFASESDAVTIRVADDLDISRGDMFSSPNEKPTIDNYYEATICWMGERTSLKAGVMMRIKHMAHIARALVVSVKNTVDAGMIGIPTCFRNLSL
tara:strand:+ start:156 stop:494 length:339 start_codon:yes stop_codon:yes gene_type:complete